MTDQMDERVRLDDQAIEPGAVTLARAFQDYPVFTYVFPNPEERKTKLPSFFRSMVKYGLDHGEVHATSSAMEGVTVWLPPGIAGGTSKDLEVDKEGLKRFRYYGGQVYGVRQKHAPGPHWFLELIGVRPGNQGEGYARRLLRPMLEKVDQERLPCYLDTELEKNVTIYQRYGFKVVDDAIVPGTGVRSWGMLRDPFQFA